MSKYIFGLLIIILIVWVYCLQFKEIDTDEKIFTDVLMKHEFLKTGDLILFKAYNNFNSIFHGSYFGHIGVVYIRPEDGLPMLFEANGIERVPLLPHHSKKGIFLTPLAERIKKYKGKCYWKPLSAYLDSDITIDFAKFINYCLEEFEYDYSVIKGGIERGVGVRRCDKKTDCGQITFLSLIKLGLLPIEEYDNNCFHHLKYVCGVVNLLNDYKYLDLIQIIEHPFAV
jgi:hypothetical protein